MERHGTFSLLGIADHLRQTRKAELAGAATGATLVPVSTAAPVLTLLPATRGATLDVIPPPYTVPTFEPVDRSATPVLTLGEPSPVPAAEGAPRTSAPPEASLTQSAPTLTHTLFVNIVGGIVVGLILYALLRRPGA